MDVRITARHFELDPELKRHVEEKVSHLSHYFDRVDEAHVVLDAEGRRMIACVTVHASRAVISSEQEAGDMRAAFDKSIDKVERQIRKYKGRIRNRKGGEPTAEVAQTSGGAAIDQIGIVSEELAAHPMTPVEAFKELTELNIRFLVFWNSETEAVSVIYRRDDGDYGLVEPEA
ncbi:MAG: ribosome-associated translation inhibitor RaiA [Candidatus Eisenbacteria bacterium]